MAVQEQTQIAPCSRYITSADHHTIFNTTIYHNRQYKQNKNVQLKQQQNSLQKTHVTEKGEEEKNPNTPHKCVLMGTDVKVTEDEN